MRVEGGPAAAPDPARAEARAGTLKRAPLRGLAAVAALILAAGLVVFAVQRLRRAQAAVALPTAPARQGDFLVLVRCRGEMKARRSTQLIAPMKVPELRIVWLAPTGSIVKAGEPVIRFDPSSARQQLVEKEAALQHAQASLDQAAAEARLAAEQDKLELATARHDVERAKLEVKKAEIVSALQAEQSRIELGLAEQKLKVQVAKVQFNDVSQQARVASLTRARDKAHAEVEVARYRLERMERTAPGDGLVHYMPNQSQGWINAKPFKIGDQVWPGAVIAEIPDLDSLEMEGRVEEIDRGRLREGQEVRLRLDALPEVAFPARLALLSPMTVMGWEWPPTRTFRGFARIEKPDSRVRPGMNGAMDIVIQRIPGAISIPAKALFTSGGRPTVYISERGSYRAFQVQVLARNPDEIAVRGLAEGSQVALVEPDQAGRKLGSKL